MSLTPELLALSDNWCLPFIWIDGKLMFPFIVFPVASLSLFSFRSRVRFSFAVAKLQRFFALCKCSREIFQYLREQAPQIIDNQRNKNMYNNVNLCKHYISQLCCTTSLPLIFTLQSIFPAEKIIRREGMSTCCRHISDQTAADRASAYICPGIE